MQILNCVWAHAISTAFVFFDSLPKKEYDTVLSFAHMIVSRQTSVGLSCCACQGRLTTQVTVHHVQLSSGALSQALAVLHDCLA